MVSLATAGDWANDQATWDRVEPEIPETSQHESSSLEPEKSKIENNRLNDAEREQAMGRWIQKPVDRVNCNNCEKEMPLKSVVGHNRDKHEIQGIPGKQLSKPTMMFVPNTPETEI